MQYYARVLKYIYIFYGSLAIAIELELQARDIST